jgi:Rod binding domain-containing protein
MQSLAGSLTASGGIGIAKMITKHLLASSEKTKESSTDNSVRAAHRANIQPAETGTK